ncbi:MAG: polymer-forming cytoskeletal protein, partial [Actinomycetota bacterium]|nr:polymer-forming cytoskeletal protein [Actinomycetota bacterium]
MRRLIPSFLFGSVVLGSALVGSVVPAGALAAGSPASATAPPPHVQVVLSGDVHVRRGEVSRDVVVVHGSANVEGIVRGSVVVFDGPVTVSGLVKGDVAALDGTVTLLRGAHVTGDVWVGRGRAVTEVGSAIDGRLHTGTILRFAAPGTVVARFPVWLAISLSTLLLGVLLLLLAPRGADAIAAVSTSAPGAATGWGAALFVGLPILAVLAIVTLVGIPFGVGLLLALAFLYAVGYVWTSWALGRALIRPSRHGRSLRRYPAFLVGWAILRGVGFFPIVGAIIWFAAALFGLGLMAVATWRARRPVAVLTAG